MTADRISVGELQEHLTAGRPVTVLDVRSPSDVDWEIPGAIHVDAYADLQSGQLGPLADLNLPPGPVVTVCEVGRTAAIATDLLRVNGVETLTLDGGMRSWSLAWNSAHTTISGCEVIQVRRTGKGCLSYIVESQSRRDHHGRLSDGVIGNRRRCPDARNDAAGSSNLVLNASVGAWLIVSP
jgi:rhodanese-related sulfurtransferase